MAENEPRPKPVTEGKRGGHRAGAGRKPTRATRDARAVADAVDRAFAALQHLAGVLDFQLVEGPVRRSRLARPSPPEPAVGPDVATPTEAD